MGSRENIALRMQRRLAEAIAPSLAGRVAEPRGIWPLLGIVRPNVCPAIRQANRIGLVLFTCHTIRFSGSSDFDLDLFALDNGTFVIRPGIIGGPDSSPLFAKVDTGWSTQDLPCAFLAAPVLDLDFSRGLIVPSVLYPRGFSGPFLVPVAATEPVEIPPTYPIAQLIPLYGDVAAEIELIEVFADFAENRNFEGLMAGPWEARIRGTRESKASYLIDLLSRCPEHEIYNWILTADHPKTSPESPLTTPCTK